MLVARGRGAALDRSHALATALVSGDQPVYGLSTGFGALADRYIAPDQRAALQIGLVRSHAATVGAEVEPESVRAMMLLAGRHPGQGLLGNSARPGATAWSPCSTTGITPVVREHGSLGCSGDLAPLAHVGPGAHGRGRGHRPDRAPPAGGRRPAGRRPAAARACEAKEGLALTNGTDGMLGMLCLACEDIALLRTRRCGGGHVGRGPARHRSGLPAGAGRPATSPRTSRLGRQHAALPGRLRCGRLPPTGRHPGPGRLLAALRPPGHRGRPRHPGPRPHGGGAGAGQRHRQPGRAPRRPGARPAATSTAPRSATWPTFSPSPWRIWPRSPSGASTASSIRLARTACRLSWPPTRGWIPGLMLAQYTAAALVADCRRLAVPASVDSIPTSAMQEDHVSMGWAAARKLRRAVANARRVVAIEVMTAARAIELRQPSDPAPATAAVIAGLRQSVPGIGPRPLPGPGDRPRHRPGRVGPDRGLGRIGDRPAALAVILASTGAMP